MSHYSDWTGWQLEREQAFLSARLKWLRAQLLHAEHQIQDIQGELERRAAVGEQIGDEQDGG